MSDETIALLMAGLFCVSHLTNLLLVWIILRLWPYSAPGDISHEQTAEQALRPEE
jgi:hypothetical protein